MTTQHTSTEDATIIISADKIIKITLNDNQFYDLNAYKRIASVVHELAGNEKFPTIVYVGKNTTISDQLAIYSATDIGKKSALCMAIVVKTLGKKLVLTKYLLSNILSVPVTIVNSEAEAMEWIKEKKTNI